MNETMSEKDLTILAETVEALGGSSRFKLAVASGSRAVGLGHGSSDLDLHVVPRDPRDKVPRRPRGAPAEIQVSTESFSTVEDLRGLYDSFEPTPENRGPYLFDSAHLWRLMRLVIGPVIISDEDTDFLRSYDSTNLRRTFVGSFSIVSARALEDAAGLAAVKEHGSALDVSIQALRAAAEAALAASGDLYAVPKFLVKRLERSEALSAIKSEVLDALLLGDERFEIRTRLTTSLAQGLGGWANQVAWEMLPVALTPTRSEARYRRAPGFGLIRYSTSWSLAGVPRSFRLNDQGASAWLAAPENGDGDALVPLISAGVVIDETAMA